jgi:hypothetical protein
MGYDRYPEQLIEEKQTFLEDKIARGVRLFFTHDLDCAMARAARDERGKFHAIEQFSIVAGMVLDDSTRAVERAGLAP